MTQYVCTSTIYMPLCHHISCYIALHSWQTWIEVSATSSLVRKLWLGWCAWKFTYNVTQSYRLQMNNFLNKKLQWRHDKAKLCATHYLPSRKENSRLDFDIYIRWPRLWIDTMDVWVIHMDSVFSRNIPYGIEWRNLWPKHAEM